MSNVFQEKPNIVTVQISDEKGFLERYVVGKTVKEIAALIDGQPVSQDILIAEKKPRKPRRTKAEMQAANSNQAEPESSEVPPPHSKQKSEVWP